MMGLDRFLVLSPIAGAVRLCDSRAAAAVSCQCCFIGCARTATVVVARCGAVERAGVASRWCLLRLALCITRVGAPLFFFALIHTAE